MNSCAYLYRYIMALDTWNPNSLMTETSNLGNYIDHYEEKVTNKTSLKVLNSEGAVTPDSQNKNYNSKRNCCYS